MPLTPLPALLIEPIVRQALIEDLGRAGDITTDAIAPADRIAGAVMASRQEGVVAGLEAAALAFRLMDAAIGFTAVVSDGARVARGETVAKIEGPARGMLSAERVALNFVSRLSGVASATARLVAAVAAYQGAHRLHAQDDAAPALDREIRGESGRWDATIASASTMRLSSRTIISRSPAASPRRSGACARHVGHLVKIEVEVDTLAQLEEALGAGVDAVLLDNMSLDDLSRAVKMIGGRAISEASGRVSLETAPAIAETGVDLISVGWLTHSAPILDIGLDAKV